MPNFNTHWLVAINCLDAAPTYIRNGYTQYRKIAKDFRKNLYDKLEAVFPTGKTDNSRDDFKTLEDKAFRKLCQRYEAALRKKSVYDDITCFAAYTLGACGPDFWTTTSNSRMGIIPDTAGIHFDLGHYNRTHRQFQVAVKRWKQKAGGDKKFTQTLQFKVELSYFLGMASHIATDLIFHQLVNVYAGAYNLLDKKWENEHGKLPKNLWNTHNKVEHFWDSYIRYRYLGDYGPLWPANDKQNILAPLGLPVVESLIKRVEQHKAFKAKSTMLKWLKKEKTKLDIEKCFIFPRVACDRIGKKNTVQPFIYDIVVDKSAGSYPRSEIFNEAFKEAFSYQMGDPDGGGQSERRKLAYFRSDNNRDTNGCSFNYLNYYVCPNLERTKKYGNHVFYHLNAFESFINAATLVSRIFLKRFQVSVTKMDDTDVGSVDHFWNLDTGLGLKVSKVAADSAKEAITELDFVHICDFLKTAAITYRGYTADLKCMSKSGSPKVKSFDTISYPSPPKRAFETYAAKQAFNNINDVFEESGKKKAYLDKIKLKNRVSLESLVTLDTFFKPAKQTSVKHQLAETARTKETNKLVVADQKHRLTLRLKTAIVPFRQTDRLGFYLLGDAKKNVGDSVKFKEGKQKEWLKDSGTHALDVLQAHTGRSDKLAPFPAHFLINFENDKNLKRKIAKGEWNNVVQYEAEGGGYLTHKAHYGRNFSVSTGRQNVLTPDGDGNFWADKDFKYFRDMSPTEHIFFSLYLLVRTDQGCFDMISKQKVSQKDLETIKKIDCLGFVKIVLFYVLDKNGVSQVEAGYVDGLKVPIDTKFD